MCFWNRLRAVIPRQVRRSAHHESAQTLQEDRDAVIFADNMELMATAGMPRVKKAISARRDKHAAVSSA